MVGREQRAAVEMYTHPVCGWVEMGRYEGWRVGAQGRIKPGFSESVRQARKQRGGVDCNEEGQTGPRRLHVDDTSEMGMHERGRRGGEAIEEGLHDS